MTRHSLIDPRGLGEDARHATVLIMRHPQTAANAEGVYLGHRDSPLSELGETQRDAAVAGLVDWKPDTLMSSPFARCCSITEHAAEALGLEPIFDERLVELCFGELEGKTYADAVERGIGFPWGPDATAWPCEGGEPIEDFIDRIDSFVEDLRNAEGSIAVVTHGVVIRALLARLMGMPEDRMWRLSVRNVQSVLFELNDGVADMRAFGIEPHELVTRRSQP